MSTRTDMFGTQLHMPRWCRRLSRRHSEEERWQGLSPVFTLDLSKLSLQRGDACLQRGYLRRGLHHAEVRRFVAGLALADPTLAGRAEELDEVHHFGRLGHARFDLGQRVLLGHPAAEHEPVGLLEPDIALLGA